jgi:hypothetical protein
MPDFFKGKTYRYAAQEHEAVQCNSLFWPTMWPNLWPFQAPCGSCQMWMQALIVQLISSLGESLSLYTMTTAFTDYRHSVYSKPVRYGFEICRVLGTYMVYNRTSRETVYLLKAWYVTLLDFDAVFNRVHPHLTIICRSIPLGESLAQYTTIMTFTDQKFRVLAPSMATRGRHLTS